MVEDHLGQRRDTKASWTKLFSGFRVALDMKKLLLAAAGIVVMAFGWWVLSAAFYGMRAKPEPKTYDSKEERPAAWKEFQLARLRWNFLHNLAGDRPVALDEGDIAASFEEYDVLAGLKTANDAGRTPVILEKRGEKADVYLKQEKRETKLIPVDEKVDAPELIKLVGKSFALEQIQITDEKLKQIRIGAANATVDSGFDSLKSEIDLARSLPRLIAEAQADPTKRSALEKFDALRVARYKPAGLLRTLPWFEDRGPNPYLVVGSALTDNKILPTARATFPSWFQVLLEPLTKMLAPVVFFFDRGAGGMNRFYLILIILWTLGTWAFFGGAITRMAAVQVARGEKVGMREALGFARQRFQSFFSAPVLPLVFLGILTFFLILFGLFAGLIPILGDIFIAGFLWPIVLILGLVMAVVLVGLVGWPLMNPTISAEGSDSFDALSRSYSYVYQAPWHYLWYSAVALVYGVALVFFVGLMGSLIVYLGSWGIRQAPFLAGTVENDRQPHFLFVHAPTSFGWRDLLLHDSPFAERKVVLTNRGVPVDRYEMNAAYMREMRWYNWAGAFLVSIWLYVLFLLIVGFGYSYFWSASTIIYLLMRQKVDDTDLDEVHLEDEDLDDTFAPDLPATPPAAPTSGTPASSGVTMVESPTLRASPPPAPAPAAPTPPATPPSSPPPSAPVTQLAPNPEPPPDNTPPPAGGPPTT